MANFNSQPRQDQYSTTITADIGAGDVLIPLATPPSFSMTTGGTNSFYIVIDYDSIANFEIVECDGVSGNNVNVKAGGRGKPKYEGGPSTAKSHAAGAKVMITDTWITWADISTAVNSKLNSSGGTITGPVDFSGATTTFELPNLTTAQRNALVSPANGMKIYNTTVGEFQGYSAGSWITEASGSTQPNASETVAGKVEQATLAEQGSQTEFGGTGAPLFMNPKNTAKTSSGAGDENKIVLAGVNGKIAEGFLQDWISEGGDGSDGALNVSSGTTTLTTYKVYQYSSITIASGATLAFNSNFQNKPIIILCSGNADIQGTISVNGLGAIATTTTTGVSSSLTATTAPADRARNSYTTTGGASFGGHPYSTDPRNKYMFSTGLINRFVYIGHSGQNGAANGNTEALGGLGGNGGGGILIIVRGNLTLTSSTLTANGSAGGTGANGITVNLDGAGGGGGGEGGSFRIFYYGTLTGSPTTHTANGGAAGTGGNNSPVGTGSRTGAGGGAGAGFGSTAGANGTTSTTPGAKTGGDGGVGGLGIVNITQVTTTKPIFIN